MGWNEHFAQSAAALAAKQMTEAQAEYNRAIQAAMLLPELDRNAALNVLAPFASLLSAEGATDDNSPPPAAATNASAATAAPAAHESLAVSINDSKQQSQDIASEELSDTKYFTAIRSQLMAKVESGEMTKSEADAAYRKIVGERVRSKAVKGAWMGVGAALGPLSLLIPQVRKALNPNVDRKK